ncbi:MAG: hypothetical protein LQ338_008208 [Usnochroma carphineum]|nr:MAG: hypothetical protein LQ338_008208 [Usnochroma carphineum]
MSRSPSLPTPAADNLAEALDFDTKGKKTPRTVTFFPAPQQQPPPPPPSQVLHSHPHPNSAPHSVGTEGGGEGAEKKPTFTFTSADPVRYITWGPRTVYYAHTPSSKSTSKKKGKENGGAKFEKVVLNGSEEVQTTETTEVLGPREGGGVRRTWVVRSVMTVVGVEREVGEVEGEGEGGKEGKEGKKEGGG